MTINQRLYRHPNNAWACLSESKPGAGVALDPRECCWQGPADVEPHCKHVDTNVGRMLRIAMGGYDSDVRRCFLSCDWVWELASLVHWLWLKEDERKAQAEAGDE